MNFGGLFFVIGDYFFVVIKLSHFCGIDIIMEVAFGVSQKGVHSLFLTFRSAAAIIQRCSGFTLCIWE